MAGKELYRVAGVPVHGLSHHSDRRAEAKVRPDNLARNRRHVQSINCTIVHTLQKEVALPEAAGRFDQPKLVQEQAD